MSPFIPVKVVGDFRKVVSALLTLGVQIKLPYASEDNPEFSVRDDVIAIPNIPRLDYSKIFKP